MDTRDELVEYLRVLRRASRGIVKAVITLACHNATCAVQLVCVEIQERHRDGVRPFQNPVRCVRCDDELMLVQFDPR